MRRGQDGRCPVGPMLVGWSPGAIAAGASCRLTPPRFPDLVRQPVKNGARFLVNITNDAWFGQSAASYQHMAMGALRAVENRVPIVRAANTGISGVIDPDGRLRDTTRLFVKDLVIADIEPRAEGALSLYARVGDVFSWACLVLSGLLIFFGRKGAR